MICDLWFGVMLEMVECRGNQDFLGNKVSQSLPASCKVTSATWLKCQQNQFKFTHLKISALAFHCYINIFSFFNKVHI